MQLWRRRGRVPDNARAQLGLSPGERVLAAGRQVDGRWLVGTDQALVGEGLRVPWVDVAHAQWLPSEQVLVLDPVPGAFGTIQVRLEEPGRLPETVHERVMASIVVTTRVAVPGAGGVRIVGRRGVDGPLVWQVVPDAGVDLAADDVRSAAEETVQRLRAELNQ